jgi:dihydroxyacetone kinase phosphoprotein-dependent L subunit
MSDLRTCILATCDAIDAARDELGALDAIAGDGDHGTTMSIGARNVRQKLAAATDATGVDLLRQVALGMGSVGGAIGPIWATGILRFATELKDHPAGTPLGAAELATAAAAAEQAIMTLGKAKPGDKTILDALDPLVAALRASADRNDDLATASAAAAAAATGGAESTAAMIATMGRASRLGEQSRGWADPGATSFALVVRTLVATAGEQ